MDRCLENVFSKGNGEVTVGAHPAVSAWLGGVHKHGGVHSPNDTPNQTHCKQQTTQLHAAAAGWTLPPDKKLCTHLGEGACELNFQHTSGVQASVQFVLFPGVACLTCVCVCISVCEAPPEYILTLEYLSTWAARLGIQWG